MRGVVSMVGACVSVLFAVPMVAAQAGESPLVIEVDTVWVDYPTDVPALPPDNTATVHAMFKVLVAPSVCFGKSITVSYHLKDVPATQGLDVVPSRVTQTQPYRGSAPSPADQYASTSTYEMRGWETQLMATFAANITGDSNITVPLSVEARAHGSQNSATGCTVMDSSPTRATTLLRLEIPAPHVEVAELTPTDKTIPGFEAPLLMAGAFAWAQWRRRST